MPYTRITGTRNGADALAYAAGTDGKGHNGNEARNECVTPVGMLPDYVEPYDVQMGRYWDKAASKNKNQVRRVVQSFSRKELDPDSPADILTANEIGQRLAREAYPDRQAVVYTQIDGKSGLIHNHIIINNVSTTDYKGCTDDQTKYWYVKEHTNRIAGEYFTLDFGEAKTKDRVTQNERARREKGKYVWKDDLKDRITASVESATDATDFVRQLRKAGVKVQVKNSKKYGKYMLYELVDTSGFKEGDKVPQNLKAKSYKLGTDYDWDTVIHKIIGKPQTAAKAATQPTVERPVTRPKPPAPAQPSRQLAARPAAPAAEPIDYGVAQPESEYTYTPSTKPYSAQKPAPKRQTEKSPEKEKKARETAQKAPQAAQAAPAAQAAKMDFYDWMKKTGQSYITYTGGVADYDWDKEERLRREYAAYMQQPDKPDRPDGQAHPAEQAKAARQAAEEKTRKQAQATERRSALRRDASQLSYNNQIRSCQPGKSWDGLGY